MDRRNPYEAAFETYLRRRRIGYIAVDETRRSELDEEPVKSLDFVVMAPGRRLLVDVKGRRFPGGTADQPRKVWETWATREDVAGLHRWAAGLAPAAEGVFAFVYHIQPGYRVEDAADQIEHRGESYLVRAVSLDDYRRMMRPRSEKWDTVHLSRDDFRDVVRPFSEFLTPCEALT